MALLTASVAVLNKRLRAPKKPLAILNIFLLFFLAVMLLFTLGILHLSFSRHYPAETKALIKTYHLKDRAVIFSCFSRWFCPARLIFSSFSYVLSSSM